MKDRRGALVPNSEASILALIVQRAAERDGVVRITRPLGWTDQRFDRFLELHAQAGHWLFTRSVSARGVQSATVRVRRSALP